MEPIKAYLKDIEKIPLLTAQEEIDLTNLAKKGDVKAEKSRKAKNNKGKNRTAIFLEDPWKIKGKTGKFCYDCHWGY